MHSVKLLFKYAARKTKPVKNESVYTGGAYLWVAAQMYEQESWRGMS